jgi:hypothetical protein
LSKTTKALNKTKKSLSKKTIALDKTKKNLSKTTIALNKTKTGPSKTIIDLSKIELIEAKNSIYSLLIFSDCNTNLKKPAAPWKQRRTNLKKRLFIVESFPPKCLSSANRPRSWTHN